MTLNIAVYQGGEMSNTKVNVDILKSFVTETVNNRKVINFGFSHS